MTTNKKRRNRKVHIATVQAVLQHGGLLENVDIFCGQHRFECFPVILIPLEYLLLLLKDRGRNISHSLFIWQCQVRITEKKEVRQRPLQSESPFLPSPHLS